MWCVYAFDPLPFALRARFAVPQLETTIGGGVTLTWVVIKIFIKKHIPLPLNLLFDLGEGREGGRF